VGRRVVREQVRVVRVRIAGAGLQWRLAKAYSILLGAAFGVGPWAGTQSCPGHGVGDIVNKRVNVPG